jgi:hypothetical protein
MSENAEKIVKIVTNWDAFKKCVEEDSHERSLDQ